jgi:hypothetical protein
MRCPQKLDTEELRILLVLSGRANDTRARCGEELDVLGQFPIPETVEGKGVQRGDSVVTGLRLVGVLQLQRRLRTGDVVVERFLDRPDREERSDVDERIDVEATIELAAKHPDDGIAVTGMGGVPVAELASPHRLDLGQDERRVLAGRNPASCLGGLRLRRLGCPLEQLRDRALKAASRVSQTIRRARSAAAGCRRGAAGSMPAIAGCWSATAISLLMRETAFRSDFLFLAASSRLIWSISV